MVEKLPKGLHAADAMRWRSLSNGNDLDALHHGDSIAAQNLINNSNDVSNQLYSLTFQPAPANGISGLNPAQSFNIEATVIRQNCQNDIGIDVNGFGLEVNAEHVHNYGEARRSSSRSGYLHRNDSRSLQNMENGSKPRSPASEYHHVEAEWIEQYEPGVYITLIGVKDGLRGLKRVRFR